MAKKEPDGTVTLAECNRNYMENNKAVEQQMGGAQRAAHRAIDIAFGKVGATGRAIRERKPLRSVPGEPSAQDKPTGELT
jgi:hypothetical protein